MVCVQFKSISISCLVVFRAESFLAKRLVLFGIKDNGQGIRHFLGQIAGRRWRRYTNNVGIIHGQAVIDESRGEKAKQRRSAEPDKGTRQRAGIVRIGHGSGNGHARCVGCQFEPLKNQEKKKESRNKESV